MNRPRLGERCIDLPALPAIRRVVQGLLLLLLLTRPAACEEKDRVQIRYPGGSRIGVAGKILDYTGREIKILLNNEGQPKTYDVRQVADVSYTRTPSHDNGIQAMQAGQYEEALRLLGIGLAEEQRQWVRREILALQLRCELRLGHYGSAGAKFLAIVESDPDTQYYTEIPLIWTPRQLTNDDRILAREWIERPNDAAQLLGASFLLDDPALQSTALRMLKKLATHPDGRIFGLARAQAWRPVIQTRKPTADDLSLWSRQVEQTPETLRAGPYYLLGRAYLIGQEYQKAAQAFLWVPLVYGENRELAARSALEAAHALAADGMAEQAQTLYREVVQRFADTPYAGEAKAALAPKP